MSVASDIYLDGITSEELADYRAEMELYLDRTADVIRSSGSEQKLVAGQSAMNNRVGRVPDYRGGNTSTLEIISTLPCRVSVQSTNPVELTGGGSPIMINHFLISFKWDSDVRVGDIIAVTGNRYTVQDTNASESDILLLACNCIRTL